MAPLSEQALKNKRKYSTEWARKNTIIVSIQLRKGKDDDIIEYVKTVGNKNLLIKNILRDFIKKVK